MFQTKKEKVLLVTVVILSLLSVSLLVFYPKSLKEPLTPFSIAKGQLDSFLEQRKTGINEFDEAEILSYEMSSLYDDSRVLVTFKVKHFSEIYNYTVLIDKKWKKVKDVSGYMVDEFDGYKIVKAEKWNVLSIDGNLNNQSLLIDSSLLSDYEKVLEKQSSLMESEDFNKLLIESYNKWPESAKNLHGKILDISPDLETILFRLSNTRE